MTPELAAELDRLAGEDRPMLAAVLTALAPGRPVGRHQHRTI